jgi:hypothetical protein
MPKRVQIRHIGAKSNKDPGCKNWHYLKDSVLCRNKGEKVAITAQEKSYLAYDK